MWFKIQTLSTETWFNLAYMMFAEVYPNGNLAIHLENTSSPILLISPLQDGVILRVKERLDYLARMTEKDRPIPEKLK